MSGINVNCEDYEGYVRYEIGFDAADLLLGPDSISADLIDDLRAALNRIEEIAESVDAQQRARWKADHDGEREGEPWNDHGSCERCCALRRAEHERRAAT